MILPCLWPRGHRSLALAPWADRIRAGRPKKPSSVLDFNVKDIDGKEVALSKYQGKVLLIVNTASQCGLTPQYKGLQEIYQKYKDQGFEVLAFPANEFGQQEPGTDDEIKEFCSTKYKVSFPLFSKIVVKGKGIHPLYAIPDQRDDQTRSSPARSAGISPSSWSTARARSSPGSSRRSAPNHLRSPAPSRRRLPRSEQGGLMWRRVLRGDPISGLVNTTALFVFQTAAAGTRVIAADLGSGRARVVGCLRSCGG